MRHQPCPGADVEGVLAPRGRREVDQPSRDPFVLAARPAVVVRRDTVEEIDQVVDHLVRGIRVHQGGRALPKPVLLRLAAPCYHASSLKSGALLDRGAQVRSALRVEYRVWKARSTQWRI